MYGRSTFAVTDATSLARRLRDVRDPREQLLRRDRAVALVDPPLEHRHRHLVLWPERRGDPAGFAEAVAGRLGERVRQRLLVVVDQLRRQAQAGLVGAHEQERLLGNLDRALAPGMV